MRRVLVLGTVIGVAAVSMATFGQAPTGPSAKAIEATKIEKVKDNLYIITGSGAGDQTAFSGGNTAVFITDAGVTLVDTKLPGYGPTLLERIKTVTDKPVTRIINTHSHSDHTGGNAFFGPTVESIVHENAKRSLAADPGYAGERAKFAQNAARDGLADLCDLRIVLQHLSRDVEGQILAVDYAAHKAEIGREQVGVIGDVDAAHVKLDMALALGPK